MTNVALVKAAAVKAAIVTGICVCPSAVVVHYHHKHPHAIARVLRKAADHLDMPATHANPVAKPPLSVPCTPVLADAGGPGHGTMDHGDLVALSRMPTSDLGNSTVNNNYPSAGFASYVPPYGGGGFVGGVPSGPVGTISTAPITVGGTGGISDTNNPGSGSGSSSGTTPPGEIINPVQPMQPVAPGTPTSPASSAPEPAMWVMLVAGFGLVGAVARTHFRSRTQNT